ncbi:MAG: ABC transporter permease [Caldilineaceae bacterium]|nr:ABC transporter permease [Caldilineaceae bacterium]
MIRVNGTQEQQLDQAYINTIANDVADKIERSGRVVQRVNVPTPGKLPLQDLFDAISLLLTPLGLLALALSSFLVINTISAMMAQQVRQIGIMKSIGGDRRQIATMYLSAVAVYSLLALFIAVPLTVVVVGGIAQFLGAFYQRLPFPRSHCRPMSWQSRLSSAFWCRCWPRSIPSARGQASRCARQSRTLASAPGR